ncbi:hypothetical protein M422DRAFT_68782 [Sphaerobolus stellatus SS14]|uniref:Smr domain-containing protein n=1 Tax=Sphaerobolus stellatus (strain SS14) TaxID=990650 RepID=A0A0C9U8S9_SPHS4|nr:hypothetical protein M422DRAFT_68782 [Sphaerobolus stellatus SS14]
MLARLNWYMLFVASCLPLTAVNASSSSQDNQCMHVHAASSMPRFDTHSLLAMSSSTYSLALSSLTSLLGREILARVFQQYDIAIRVFTGLAVGIWFNQLSEIPEEILVGISIYGIPDFIFNRNSLSAILPGIGWFIAFLAEDQTKPKRGPKESIVRFQETRIIMKGKVLKVLEPDISISRQEAQKGPGTSHITYVHMFPPLSAFSDNASSTRSTFLATPEIIRSSEEIKNQLIDTIDFDEAEYTTAREPSIAESTPKVPTRSIEDEDDLYTFDLISSPIVEEVTDFEGLLSDGRTVFASEERLHDPVEEGLGEPLNGEGMPVIEDAVSETASQTTSISPFELQGPARELKRRAEEYRQQSIATKIIIETLEDQRKQALQMNNGGEAFRLKYDIKEFLKNAKKADRKAAKLNFRARNTASRDGRRVDVHALKPGEALEVTEEALRAIQLRGGRELTVIVGQGLHSKGKPVLKPYLMREMRKQKLRVFQDPSNAGAIKIVLT